MKLTTYFIAAVVAVLPLVDCGGGEEARKTPAPAKAPGTAKIVAWCIAQWESGPKGAFTCDATAGPNQQKPKVTKANFRLDMLCVNDKRLTKYTFDGNQVESIPPTGEPPTWCVKFDSIARLPESCLCDPQGGQSPSCDTAPQGRFVCAALGHLEGTP